MKTRTQRFIILDHFVKNHKGQAMVEYMLMIVVAMGIVVLMVTTFRSSILRIWEYYIKEISAACPDCPPNPGYRF